MVAFRITFRLLAAGMLLLGSAPSACCLGESSRNAWTTCCAADGCLACRGTGRPDCQPNSPQERITPSCVSAGALSLEREPSNLLPSHRERAGPSLACGPTGGALQPATSNSSRSPLGRPLLVFCHVLLS